MRELDSIDTSPIGAANSDHPRRRSRRTARGIRPGLADVAVSKRGAIFLGQARALLSQLAHPLGCRGDTQHSRYVDPIGRFMAPSVSCSRWSSPRQTQACAARASRPPACFGRGSLPERRTFAAGSRMAKRRRRCAARFTPPLIDTAVAASKRAPAAFHEDRERYWGEARLFAAFFGIPQDALPQSWDEFRLLQRDHLAIGCSDREQRGAEDLPGRPLVPEPDLSCRPGIGALTARLRGSAARRFGLPYGEARATRLTERSHCFGGFICGCRTCRAMSAPYQRRGPGPPGRRPGSYD